jgi:hypothetical protein
MGQLQDWWDDLPADVQDRLAKDPEGPVPEDLLEEVTQAGVPVLQPTSGCQQLVRWVLLPPDLQAFVEAKVVSTAKRLAKAADG